MSKTNKNKTEDDLSQIEAKESSKTKRTDDNHFGLLRQGFITLACWMTFGLFLEGLLGYKIPIYLNDNMRRELFRLAHTHGALLSVILIIVAICLRLDFFQSNNYLQYSLRIGSIVMPLGFLLGGVWHYESDPGIAVWLVPVGAVMVIFGIVSAIFSIKGSK